MSTKTVTKRVALATVVALGAGVLSLVTVSSASAAETITNNVASNAADGITAAATSGSAASIGVIAIGSGTGLAETATLSASGKIAVVYLSGAGIPAIQVTGGTITAATQSGGSSLLVTNGTFVSGSTSTTTVTALIAPNAGVSSFTVGMYKSVTSLATSTATSGTLEKLLTVSVASASVADVLSLTNTKTYYHATTVATTQTSGYTGSDVASANFATSAFFTVAPRDAYNTVLSSSHFVQVSATNGALVSITNTGTNATTPTLPSAFVATSGSASTDPVVQVKAAGALLAGGTTSVTVTIDGVVVAVVPFTFTGKVAKVVLGSAGNGYSGASTSAAPARFSIAFYDAAGNTVYPVSASTAYPQNLAKNANAWKGFGTSLAATSYPTSSTTGYLYFGCPSGTNVTDAAVMDYTNADGTVVSSNSTTFTCSGIADSYSAKLDKSTYKPGDIATLAHLQMTIQPVLLQQLL